MEDTAIENILISVIIPVYNVESYLKRCIGSILCQTHRNLEIILVNDGSADKSGVMCDQYAKEDNRIRVIHQDNTGAGMARNTGLNAATGEWIGFVDSDDRIEPDMYEVLLGAAIQHNGHVICCGHYIYRNNTVTNVTHFDIPRKITLEQYCDYNNRDIIGFVSPCTKLYPRSVFDGDTGVRFLQDCKHGEDNLFAIEVLLKAEVFIYIPKSLYWYCIREGSSLYSPFRERKMDVLNAAKRIITLLEPVSADLALLSYIHYANIAIALMWEACYSEKYEYIPRIRKEIRKYMRVYLLSGKTKLKRKLRFALALACPKITANMKYRKRIWS